MPNSPVSTNAGVYDQMPQDVSNKERLDFLYSNVHHHRSLVPKEFLGVGENWLYRAFPADEELVDAFPDRPYEEDPPKVYYSQQGIRTEQFVSDRTSWRSDNFTLPPGRSGKGKRKEGQETVTFAEGSHPEKARWEEVPKSLRKINTSATRPAIMTLLVQLLDEKPLIGQQRGLSVELITATKSERCRRISKLRTREA
ncbi:hypothetical protein K438DRAFT_1787838 [Mycena galopus ATCC 62051]|nr:hypothetical protein K438DRAFT_1787838 [Mycena galopus ATCC 62051]